MKYRQAKLRVSENSHTIGWIPQYEWRGANVLALYDPPMSRCDKCHGLMGPTVVTCHCGGKPK